MPKKRVHEVAKELGLENKVLIAHLEKIGIAVKAAASSLDESEVERIKKALLATEYRETVEERIKSTVIRRRTVRTFIETPVEEVPEKEEEQPETVLAEKPEDVSSKQPVGKIDKVKKEEPPETPVSEIEAVPAQPKEHAPKGEKTTQHKEQIPKDETTVPTDVQPMAAAQDKTVAGKIKHPSLVSAKSAVIAKHKIILSETSTAIPPKAPLKPGEKITIPLPEKPKKKGKATVEVFIEEEKVVPLRKILEKKIEKRLQKHNEEDEVSYVKWRDNKKVVPAKMKKTEITVPKAIKRRIKIGETIAVGDLAKRMGVKVSEVINKLMAMDVMATINQAIDYDIASIVAGEFSFQVESAELEFDEAVLKTPSTPENLKPRAPVVTIMGHVDHGKTSLLDVIRQSNVIDGEAGGITQAIGAYHVHINGRDIVFLDTPGHEAFTAMRARGAQVTDIVVLVVAADDGVMGQTIEAINHSKVAGVPIIVAINKIDKPGADPEKIKQSLMEHGLLSEQLGGETIFCEVSAKKKINIEELLEMILLQADVMELKADPDLPARGIIIEAKLDRGRGPVATVLIQEGTLREGDSYVSKTEFGRVRAMINDQGRRIKEAGPSMPVEVIGFSSVPQTGAEFFCVEDEKKARGIADYWTRKAREKELSSFSKVTLEQLYQRIKEGVKECNVIIKADVQGSIEAISDALNKLSTDDIKLRIIHSSTGAISETDVMLASASQAIIIGFNVRPDARVVDLAQQEGVEIKLYDIIYNVIADVRAAMEGLLEPEYKEVVQGRAEVRELFKVPKVGTIAGCYVTDGKIMRSNNVKLVRDSVAVFDGKILSLRRFKDDAREVQAGFECGISIEGFNDIHPGDVIESYITETLEKKLE
ncbi:translation initiation factor IF-2 [Smithella sp. SCADC]|jgi:translation initiation factor IF-2|nr:translation initiation factor IF-2 [Smithella sp. SCADC]HAR50011.1 translation initiation factor IF-2 [Smithella sp.]